MKASCSFLMMLSQFTSYGPCSSENAGKALDSAFFFNYSSKVWECTSAQIDRRLCSLRCQNVQIYPFRFPHVSIHAHKTLRLMWPLAFSVYVCIAARGRETWARLSLINSGCNGNQDMVGAEKAFWVVRRLLLCYCSRWIVLDGASSFHFCANIKLKEKTSMLVFRYEFEVSIFMDITAFAKLFCKIITEKERNFVFEPGRGF